MPFTYQSKSQGLTWLKKYVKKLLLAGASKLHWLWRKEDRVIAMFSINTIAFILEFLFNFFLIESVAVTWMNGVFPSMRWIISLGISISLLNTTVCGILTVSRNFYSASQEGQLPFIYAMLNDHHCPVVAVTQIIILSSVVILFLNVTYTIKYIGQVYTFMNALNMMALLKLRYKEPDLPRPYKLNQSDNIKFLLSLYE